ncbi:putative disease resistance protein RGA4 [Medicago truncatula]|uniref:Disease resistance protein (CC-NBS-LRR class) family protein n=1 Tax=Medicago truncatula TaxID=3880 RepID=G7KAY9_MEDTR|nr:putative disease resistance protein RGA4 [Medicago truncatula]AES95717.1 disease resistance protein (CC-NBS-LRR class) family protein [Medicago truncatula]
MDIVVLRETIDQLLEKIRGRKENRLLAGLSNSDKNQLITSLEKIQDLVKNHVQRHEVLSNLKTALKDLNKLVEELDAGILKPQKRTFSPFQADRHKHQLKAINSRIQNAIKDLKDVLKELSTTTTATMPPQEAWEKTGEETELEPAIVGRKKEIIDQLIPLHTGAESVGKVSVVSIVGFAGIGKTKLARLICEDEQVKAHFGLQIWIYDVEFLNTTDMSSTYTDGGKGNLVVLDNLKTEILGDEMLSDLDKILMTSNGASAILITTRSKLVANNITVSLSNYRLRHETTRPDTVFTTFKPHVILGLNEEESLSLFWKVRGQSSSIIDMKKEMQRKMVMDCGGVPFLIIFKAIFVNNHCADLAVADLNKEEFLKELKVRYYDKLPSPQKFCFEFCSLFPQDHLIDVERLIHLLTAEGFQSDLENSTEDKFRQYFNDFVGMPIFKDMEEDECGAVRRCRMQPLMHDLARFVSDQIENVTVDPEGEKVTEGVLRASFDFSLDVSRGIPPSLFKKAKKLKAILFWKTQSLLPKDMKTGYSTCGQIFKSFKATLRMLDLHDMGIKTLPNSIGDMNNLRYLDLSLNSIEKLPNSITKLSNLQTLKLSQCYPLEELPKNIDELVNLKHLEIDGCLALTHMPRKLHKLECSLQTLSLFVISDGHHVGGLSELARLNNLRGHLEISHLESLNLSKADNCLNGKNDLQRLTLRWCHEDDYGKKEEEDDQKRLDFLEPPSTLRAIFVVGYKGKTLSNWFSSIACLVKLSLYDCTSCIFLPHLHELPNLRFLELLRLDKLEYIADQSNDSDRHNDKLQAAAVHFPSLEELTISDCPNLKRWWRKDKMEKDLPFFACLSKLNVNYCPELTCMPLFPGLDEELILVGSSVKPLLDSINHGHRKCYPFSKLKSMKIANIEDSRSPAKIWIEYFNSLEKLDIKEWKHLKSLPEGFDNLNSLQSLNIENCQELDLSSTEWEGLKNLRSLTIREIPKLETLPSSIYKVTSLQDLQLHNCPQLTSLSETIEYLKSLEKLVISECDKLASLPKALKNVESLHTLIILDCTLLLPRCQSDTGDDWSQIAHIKNKQVTETNRDM